MIYKNQLIETLLKTLEPQIDKMVVDTVNWLEIKFGTKVSPFEKQCIRLELTYDMVRSVECYTERTDTLVELSAGRSNKGNLEINATINRDGVNYVFITEAIYAGGHNIQRLHYRYITRTKLPRTNNTETTIKLKTKIKTFKKIDRLQQDFDRYVKRINEGSEKLAIAKKFTDAMIIDEIKEESNWANVTWKMIIERGATENYDNNEENFNNWLKNAINNSIASWKETHINWQERYIKMWVIEMNKINVKIATEKELTKEINIIKLF